jgi:GNAT superfamily N-acetyltransferase
MSSTSDTAAAGVRSWRHRQLAEVCEIADWEFGTVARVHEWPGFFDYNTVIVERPTGLSALDLEVVADHHLADVAHRRVDVEDPEEARRLRPEFERLGWRALVLVWMRHEGELPPRAEVPGLSVEEVPYDEVIDLRREWHDQDFPGGGIDPTDYFDYARQLAVKRRERVLAVREDGRPIGFAQFDDAGDEVEVGQVFVTAARRGHGLGTALTTAALRAAAAGVRTVYICADDEDRPKLLYERLGFRPVWWTTEFLRLPPAV